MKQGLLFLSLLATFACSSPDPENRVRELRRKYKLELDFTVNDTTSEVTYEVKIQNLSETTDLQELTVRVDAYDENQNAFWSKRRELDVTGLKNYSTKTLQFKDKLEGTEQIAYFNVSLAPDDPDSDYKTYKEFLRIAR